MKLTKYILLGLMSIMLAMFSIACEDEEDTFVDDNIDAADEVRGGLLYDKWWAVNGATAPTTDLAQWSTQTTNSRSGSDTWRCKECHGWDYQGVAGAYSSGSHKTGFAGVYAARLEPADHVFEHIETEAHDFSAVLSDDDLLDLTKFITTELINVGTYVDLTTKASNGDATAGKVLYESTDATTGGGCITCHGENGLTLNFGSTDDPEYLGGLANGNPWETLHKIRFGHPGSLMPSTVAKGLTTAEANNIMSYAQTLPEVDLSSADAVAGGLLYDKWWAVSTSATEPTTEQALWSTQTSNTRSGSTTWRCKECHGWDYQGAAGAYGTSNSHYTGFTGVWGVREDVNAVYNQINSGTDHDFGAVLDMSDILNLTAFITEELVDVGTYVDLTTKASNGDSTAGLALYESTDASTGGQCSSCHGTDGEEITGVSVSGLSNDNPWEILHKIRFGHPASAMPSTVAKGLTTADANDILAYCQTSLADSVAAATSPLVIK